MNIKNTIKSLDLFALPFQFQMGKNEKEKKTILGGIISLLIILLSVSYLLYLTIQFLTNELQPKIALYEEYSFNPYQMDITEDMFQFQINLANGIPLLQYEQQTKKRYLTIVGSVIGLNKQGVQVRDDFLISACKDDSNKYCMQFGNNLEFKTLIYNQDDFKRQQIFILVSECLSYLLAPGEVCASTSESKQLLLNLSNIMKLEIKLQQYNMQEKVYQEKIRVESYLFDRDTAILSQINIKRANYTIKDGFIIQSKEKATIFQDYQRNDIQMGIDYLKDTFKFNLYGALQIQLNGSYSNIDIQYPLYTEVLAQFSSILNSLLFFGLFIRMIAQSEIMQDLAEIQLQHYYKKAAYKLLSKEEVSKFSNQGISSIINLNNYISTLDFQSKWSKQLKLNFFKKQIVQNHFYKNIKDLCNNNIILFRFSLNQNENFQCTSNSFKLK